MITTEIKDSSINDYYEVALEGEDLNAEMRRRSRTERYRWVCDNIIPVLRDRGPMTGTQLDKWNAVSPGTCARYAGQFPSLCRFDRDGSLIILAPGL